MKPSLPSLAARFRSELVRLGRHHDDLGGRQVGTRSELLEQRESIHARHHDVGQDHVGRAPVQELQCPLARFCKLHIHFVAEQLAHHLDHHRVIIDDENLASGRLIRHEDGSSNDTPRCRANPESSARGRAEV